MIDKLGQMLCINDGQTKVCLSLTVINIVNNCNIQEQHTFSPRTRSFVFFFVFL